MLGIGAGPTDAEWSRLRHLQFSHPANTLFAREGIHALAALMVLRLAFGAAPVWLEVAWLLVVTLVIFVGARIERTLINAPLNGITEEDLRRHARFSAISAVVWTVPLIYFGIIGDSAEQIGIWAVIAMLIAGSALVLSAAPLGTICFSAVAGALAVMGFLVSGSYIFAAIVSAFVAIAISGTLQSARTFLSAKVAEAGVAEKDEVVSLLLREFEENEADWLWQVDTSRRVRSISPRFAFALGMAPEEAEGRPFVELVAGASWESGQFAPSLHDLAERLKRRESFSNLLVKVAIGQESRWWELSGTPMLDDKGEYVGFRGVGSDVTEQRESSEKIAYLARYDTLTGLPNRLMLNEALGEAMRYAKQWRSRCAFLMIDLDRFKAVNDSLGHLVGDQLLAQVSKRLEDIASENETCGRLGGDEFAVVIRDASESGYVDRVARKIIERLSQPYEVDNHTLYVGASVGSALAPRDGKSVEELLRNADLALYRAKDEGGGEHCTYEPSLHASAEERRQLEFSLRRAIENNELVLHFQPVVDAQLETVVSFEALVRWVSPEHGFVSPGKFIPLAEDTRLIVPIGAWVLEQACREAVNWPKHVRIAVNVSGEQLIEPEFPATVVRALAASGLEANRLEIEVTESIFVRDAAIARAALEQVMALGCTVALDDFGTGYSSLGYLRKLRFSTIKVDRSFVQGAAKDNAESLAIIRAVVAMADALEMSTTAEGVETEAELELIRKLGCKKIQGFYFGRPMPSAEAREIFALEKLRSA
ncbi:MAG: EAL domain-containing protein [Sphingomonadales bacterium]|nr:EAL domain-containing protein [Sphingomonadales bacterium]MBD3772841.1 EAL domain-containing protein [Paracoccaceae bacterium]